MANPLQEWDFSLLSSPSPTVPIPATSSPISFTDVLCEMECFLPSPFFLSFFIHHHPAIRGKFVPEQKPYPLSHTSILYMALPPSLMAGTVSLHYLLWYINTEFSLSEENVIRWSITCEFFPVSSFQVSISISASSSTSFFIVVALRRFR